MGFVLQRVLEPLEHPLDQTITGRWIRHCRQAQIGRSGQEPPQLLEGDEFRIVHIDHHAVMIDPKISFQAHTPLETRPPLQAHTPLEEARALF